MCRSIKQLRIAGAEPTDQELHDAALQFVRKVSGYRKPSQRNQVAFERAVHEIAATTRAMLQEFSHDAAYRANLTSAGSSPSQGVHP
jgi:hypothetical protein